MYYRKPRDPSPEDFELIEAATHIAGIAIERRHVEEALHQAKLAAGPVEGVLLAGREIAHLLNNDLAIAVGALEIIRHRFALPEDLAQIVDDGLAQLARAAQHIQQLQQVSRVETSRHPAGSVSRSPTLQRVRQRLRGNFQYLVWACCPHQVFRVPLGAPREVIHIWCEPAAHTRYARLLWERRQGVRSTRASTASRPSG